MKNNNLSLKKLSKIAFLSILALIGTQTRTEKSNLFNTRLITHPKGNLLAGLERVHSFKYSIKLPSLSPEKNVFAGAERTPQYNLIGRKTIKKDSVPLCPSVLLRLKNLYAEYPTQSNSSSSKKGGIQKSLFSSDSNISLPPHDVEKIRLYTQIDQSIGTALAEIEKQLKEEGKTGFIQIPKNSLIKEKELFQQIEKFKDDNSPFFKDKEALDHIVNQIQQTRSLLEQNLSEATRNRLENILEYTTTLATLFPPKHFKDPFVAKLPDHLHKLFSYIEDKTNEDIVSVNKSQSCISKPQITNDPYETYTDEECSKLIDNATVCLSDISGAEFPSVCDQINSAVEKMEDKYSNITSLMTFFPHTKTNELYQTIDKSLNHLDKVKLEKDKCYEFLDFDPKNKETITLGMIKGRSTTKKELHHDYQNDIKAKQNRQIRFTLVGGKHYYDAWLNYKKNKDRGLLKNICNSHKQASHLNLLELSKKTLFYTQAVQAVKDAAEKKLNEDLSRARLG